jgi:hypothetical protein
MSETNDLFTIPTYKNIDRLSNDNECASVDASRSLVEFRNLEYGFMLDNGYILFDIVTKGSDTYVNNTDEIERALIESVRNNVCSSADALNELDLDGLRYDSSTLCNISDDTDLEALITQMNDVITKYNLIICIAIEDTNVNLRLGKHIQLSNINNKQRLEIYTKHTTPVSTVKMKRGQALFLHPLMLIDELISNSCRFYNVILHGTDNSKSQNIWRCWDIFIKKTDLMNLSSVESLEYFQKNPKVYRDFVDLELSGVGSFVRFNNDNIIFRIKPYSPNAIIRLVKPSIYESTVEIVYYLQARNVDAHTNYTEKDVFEVRTGGILARSCNTKFSSTLYEACCTESNIDSKKIFDLNIPKIVSMVRKIDYCELIESWYPTQKHDEKTDKNEDDNDNSSIVLGGSDKVKLKIKNVYSINVYKIDLLDEKNITRIKIIKRWMEQLNLRGGFVLSNHQSFKKKDNFDRHKTQEPSTGGYIIVAGEEIVVTHHEKIGDLAIFQNRLKCLHWKKMKHYHYSNHDLISTLKYESLPESIFCLTNKQAICLENTKYSDITSIVRHI